MKKKIYFIISAIVQIFASINLIANSNEILEKTMATVKDVYSAFPAEFQDRVISMMNNSGIYYVMAPAIICIIVNAIILILAFANKIVKKRGLLIFLSVLCIIFSSSTVATILAITNFIILLSIKKEDKQNIIDEKKKIPEVKQKNYSKKELISAAIIFLVYFSQFIWSDYIPDNNKIMSILVVISFYAIMFMLVFILFGDKLISDFKKLIKNFNAYIEYDLPKYGLMIVSFILVNFICILVTKNGTSVNQETVESLPKLIMFILAVLWAPIVEETVFRGTIRRYINNKIVFVLLSAFIFGFMHATGEGSLLKIIFTTLPYATLGGWLAYIYSKTDNLANNIMIHGIWNLFAVIMSFLISTII